MDDITSEIIATKYGLSDYPSVEQERGDAIYEQVIEYPSKYETNASLVLVQLNRETTHMTKPELERALFRGALVSVEVIPTPHSDFGHLARLNQGSATESETAYLELPEADGESLIEVFEAVTNPHYPEEQAAFWGVTHFLDFHFPSTHRNTVERLTLYNNEFEPESKQAIVETTEQMYA